MFKSVKALPFLLSLLAGLLASGCEMEKQPKYKPYVQSKVFPDQSSARVPEAHTMPVGALEAERLAMVATTPNAKNPLPLTLDNLRTGKRYFDIFCTPCHGYTGDGEGIVMKRGFPLTPSLLTPDQLAKTDSHLFNVTMNGFGKSPPFKSSISPEEAWELVGYMRALQKSQNTKFDHLTPEEKVKFSHEYN